MRSPVHRLELFLLAILLSSVSAAAERPPPSNVTVPAASSDKDAGFIRIFDGRTMKGWDANPAFWRIEKGSLMGELKTEYMGGGTFNIWRGGTVKDFEFKAEYRISGGGDSGIFYRCGDNPDKKWSVSSYYQVTLDGTQWWEKREPVFRQRWKDRELERRLEQRLPGWSHVRRLTGSAHSQRGGLAMMGQLTQLVTSSPDPIVIGVMDNGLKINEIAGEGWNEVHVIARNNIFIHVVNGHVTSVVIDDDATKRVMEGQLALELHAGPAMKVEYRNLRLKTLSP